MSDRASQPSATYRIQFNDAFTLRDGAAIAPYLASLGATHVYASPVFEAAPGSTHGYDVTDPTRIRESIGGAAGFAELLGALRAEGLGLILDIVPNHLATDPSNDWWWGVLEDGPSSPFTSIFDIDWEGGVEGSAFTVLVPVLGDHYGRVLEAGELSLVRDGGAVVVEVPGHRLPLSPRTLDEVLAPAARAEGSAALADLGARFAELPDARYTDAEASSARHRSARQLRAELADLLHAEPALAEAVDAEIAVLNPDPDRLDALLRRQNHRLARWQMANEALDYRRFFSIESLVGVRVELPEVFEATHALVLDLVREGSVDGLRVDHVDGLRDPAGYLERLAEATGGAPTVVEKILDGPEVLPQWPVAGTTGYDFLIRANGVFVEASSEQALTECYADVTGVTDDFDEIARAAKRDVMANELAAEVNRVASLLAQVCERHRRHRDHTPSELQRTLVELIASFDVYRTYARPGAPLSAADAAVLDRAIAATVARCADIDSELLALVRAVVDGSEDGPAESELRARVQQLTAPVMAKGIEDTAFYRYHRLISLNEVGGDPGTFGLTVEGFHAATARSAADWPRTMLALSTHDTKRSADVRARISVLSEEPAAWRAAVERMLTHDERHWGDAPPDRNAEYLLHQTLVGAWPIDVERVCAFMQKAVREAKVHTSWTDPDEAYEAALDRFVRGVLADADAIAILEGFLREVDLPARGRRASLAQQALLLTCPGDPDVYQGTEHWDLSLTDPDNRRPVDLARLADLLAGCSGLQLGSVPEDAQKLWLTSQLLDLRRARPDLFLGGEYEPIEVRGGGDRVLAFRRGGLAVVVACRTSAPDAGLSLELPGRWREVVRGVDLGGTLDLDDLLGRFPVAVLIEEGGR